MAKIARLFAAALITAAVCTGFLYATRPDLAYILYRCLTDAESPLDCYLNKPTGFRTTTLGIAYEGTTEDFIDNHILRFGAFEKAEMFFLRDVSRGGVFLDIGANKGLYSLFLSPYQKKIHAFEPYEPVLKKFRALVARSGIQNIVIHPVGLGDKPARLAFEKPGGINEGMGTFAFLSDHGRHEQLEIVAGDQALKDAGVTEVDLIKMDIEGFERPALIGLAETLARSRPIVLFELTLSNKSAVLFKTLEQIVQAFPADYRFLVFKNRNPYSGAYELRPMEEALNFNSDFEQHNVVAFPAENKDRIPMKGSGAARSTSSAR